MPRYHFTSLLDDYDADAEGIVLPDIDGARLRAIHFAGDILMTYTAKVQQVCSARVDVIDEAGRTVCTVLTTVTGHRSRTDGSIEGSDA